MALKVALVVPTLGRSPLLAECLRALEAEAAGLLEGGAESGERAGGSGAGAELILVAQGAGAGLETLRRLAPGLAHRRIDLPRPVGFAAAANLGIAAAEATYVALVNDDAVVEPGWLAALLSALEGAPRAASAQGVNLLAGDPERVDGWGLGWNRWLQAIQLGHGEPAPPPVPPGASEPPAREVFGASATAALYRREALLAVALPPRRAAPGPRGGAPPTPEVFDRGLGTYYEDVELAARLRAAGYGALSVSAARARHGGSLTTGSGVGRWRRVYGNRHLVAARLLGRSFWRYLPRLAARDLADLLGALGRGELGRAIGLGLGWGHAAWRLPAYLRSGPPLLAPRELQGAAGPPPAVEAP